MTISRQILLRMRNYLDKSRRENTHFMFNYFFSKNRTVYEIMSKKCSGNRRATNDVTIWRIRVACWISKDTCTYPHAHAQVPGHLHARTHAQACTHRPICTTYCFSTTTMVSRTRLSVTLHVHCLSCLPLKLTL